jgi:hypothetical protein
MGRQSVRARGRKVLQRDPLAVPTQFAGRKVELEFSEEQLVLPGWS